MKRTIKCRMDIEIDYDDNGEDGIQVNYIDEVFYTINKNWHMITDLSTTDKEEFTQYEDMLKEASEDITVRIEQEDKTAEQFERMGN